MWCYSDRCFAYLSAEAWHRRPAEPQRSPPQTWCRHQPQYPEPWTARPAKQPQQAKKNPRLFSYKRTKLLVRSTSGQDFHPQSHHFSSRVQNLHLIQDGCTVVSNGDVSLPVLDLQHKRKRRSPLCNTTWRRINASVCGSSTILSMPLGPRLVLTASATAVEQKQTNHQTPSDVEINCNIYKGCLTRFISHSHSL